MASRSIGLKIENMDKESQKAIQESKSKNVKEPSKKKEKPKKDKSEK